MKKNMYSITFYNTGRKFNNHQVNKANLGVIKGDLFS